MLVVKRFNGIKLKLKGFLMQIRLKLYNKGHKVPIQYNAVAYTGLFLTEKVLEQSKSYIIEFQNNKMTIANKEVQYIFLNWDAFAVRFIQIYRDPESELTAERKI